jgi:hypothetical protein
LRTYLFLSAIPITAIIISIRPPPLRKDIKEGRKGGRVLRKDIKEGREGGY